MKLPLLLLLAASPALGAVPENYWQDHAQGWFWYQQPVSGPEETVLPPPEQTVRVLTPGQQLEAFRARVQDSLAQAILEPSADNLQGYMELNAAMFVMAQNFAEAWQGLLWRRPELDARLLMPTADPAVQALHDARSAQRTAQLQTLATDHGLWFFFQAGCPLCKRFAPVLRGFAQDHGFAVLAISMDGSALAEFPQARMDRVAAERLDVRAIPALFLVAPGQRRVIPVGYGYMSAGELTRRLTVLAGQRS